jgi:tetratricopeptide (TPR) repeat protein
MGSQLVRAAANRNRGDIAGSNSETLAALATWDEAPASVRRSMEAKGMAADAMMSLYETSLMAGNGDAATSATLSGLELRGEIVREHPEDLLNRASLARFKTGRGDIAAIFKGDIAGAIPFYSGALEDIRQVRKSDPTRYDSIMLESQALGRLSYMHSLLPNEQVKALEYGLAGLELDESLAIRNPTNMEAQRSLAVSHSLLSISLEKSGRCEEAIEQARKSVEVQKRVCELDPTSVATLSALASRYQFLGEVLQRSGNSDESVLAFQALREIVARLPRTVVEGLTSDMGTATVWAGFSASLQNLSLILYLQEKPEEALQVLDEAKEIAKLSAVGNLESDKWLHAESSIGVRRAQILIELGQAAEALDTLDRSGRVLEQLDQKMADGEKFEGLAPDQVFGTSLDIRSLLVLSALVEGKALAATGDAEGARAALEKVAVRRVEYEALLNSRDLTVTPGSCDPESGQKRKGSVVIGMQAEADLILGRHESVREIEASGVLRKSLRSFTLRDAAKKAGYVFSDENDVEDAGQ